MLTVSRERTGNLCVAPPTRNDHSFGRRQAGESDGVMPGELARMSRHAVSGEISRARADDAADGAEPHCDQARIRQLPDAEREIDVLVDEIDHPVDQHHLHVDFTVGLQEFGHHGDDVQTAEHDRRGEDQLAPRRTVFARRRALGLGDVIEDAPAGSKYCRPVSVSDTRRVERARSCTPRLCSSSETFRLTVASGIPRRREAAEKPWASATAAKTDIASSRSMHYSNLRNKYSE